MRHAWDIASVLQHVDQGSRKQDNEGSDVAQHLKWIQSFAYRVFKIGPRGHPSENKPFSA